MKKLAKFLVVAIMALTFCLTSVGCEIVFETSSASKSSLNSKSQSQTQSQSQEISISEQFSQNSSIADNSILTSSALENSLSEEVSSKEEISINSKSSSTKSTNSSVKSSSTKSTNSSVKSSSSKSSSSKSSSSSSKSSSSKSSSSKSSSSSSKSSSSKSSSSSSKSSSSKSSSSSSKTSSSSSSGSGSSTTTNLSEYGGLSESAYVVWSDGKISSAKAYYKLTSASSWTEVDSQLIRDQGSGVARVDMLGLKAGQYDLKIDVGSSASDIIIHDVTVSAYDRSGYAHAKYTSGVGAYKDDGTLKSGVKVYYVTEATKNSVTLVKAIQEGNACIRIIGKISCPQYLSSNKLDSSITDISGISRKNLGDDSYWNMIDISGKSNITVEGVGDDAEFFQFGMTFKKCSSIEVRNLTFTDYPEDACSFEGASGSQDNYGHYWVHNNKFNKGKNGWDLTSEQDKGNGDGATDIKHCSNVTMSYNVYNQCQKTMLCGGGDSHVQYNVTLHHNYYYKNKSRLPLARQANIHIYNCFFESNTTCMSLRADAIILSEANYYKSNSAHTDSNTKCYGKSLNDKYDGTSQSKYFTTVTSRSASVSTSNKYDINFSTYEPGYLTDATKAMNDCKNFAGVAKRNLSNGYADNSWVENGSTGGGDSSEEENSSSSSSNDQSSSNSQSSSSQGGSTGDYQVVYSEDFEDLSSISSTESDSKPYYATDASSDANNKVVIESGMDGKCATLEDSTASKTMFYVPISAQASGTYKVALDIKPGSASGSWNLVEFAGTGVIIRTDSSKKIAYTANGDTSSLTASSIAISAGTTYSVEAIFDYGSNKLSLKINGTTVADGVSFGGGAISSINFITAGSASRTISVDNIVVSKK